MTQVSKGRWLLLGLASLCVVPTVAGVYRLLMLAGAVEAPSDADRLLSVPLSLSVHIVAASGFALLGALQVVPHFRATHLRLHRLLGRVVAPLGLVAALSGLWLVAALPPAPDGAALSWIRGFVGTAMTTEILLGFWALRQGDLVRHGAWMLRAYALGLGAGTQVLTHLPMLLGAVEPTPLANAVAMGGGWLLNALVAEWILRTREHQRRVAPTVAAFSSQPPGQAAVAALALLGVCSVPSLAAASPKDAASTNSEAEQGVIPAAAPGAYTHDGFFLRLGAGVGAARLRLDGDDHGLESSARGTAVASLGELAIGGTVSRGLVLGFGIHSADAGDAELDVQVRGVDGAPSPSEVRIRALGVLGPFVDYYVHPNCGLHLQAALGLGVAALRRPGDEDDVPLAGLGWMLGVGNEWWISEQWSLGVLARVVGTRVSGEHPSDSRLTYTGSTYVPGVLLTVTHH